MIPERVHIEDLYTAMQAYTNAQARALGLHAREPAKFRQIMDEAKETFRQWCEANGLPIDFGERT